MNTTKSRTPLLAVLLILGLIVAGCSGVTLEDEPTAVADRSASEPDPVADEPMSDEEIFVLAMEMTFAEMTAAELAEVCLALDVFGMDGAVEQVAAGWGAGWQSSYEPLTADMLAERCWR